MEYMLPSLVLIAQAVFLLECGQTDRQTDRQTDVTEFPTLAGGYTGSVVIILPMMCYIYMHWQSHYINGQLNYINKT